ESVIPLLPALPRQELVVAAGRELRVGLTDLWPRIVHRAAPCFRVQEHADGAEDLVLLVSKDDLAVRDLGEALLRDLLLEAEVFRQSPQIELADGDLVVAAAIRRALAAVVSKFHPRSVDAKADPETLDAFESPLPAGGDHAWLTRNEASKWNSSRSRKKKYRWRHTPSIAPARSPARCRSAPESSTCPTS